MNAYFLNILYICLIILFFYVMYFFYNLENYLFICPHFLQTNEFIKLNKLLKNIHHFQENKEKKYIYLDSKQYRKIYKLIYENIYLKKYIADTFNSVLKYPSKPIEYRIYKENKNSMDWHQDIQYVNQNYLECILVLNNTCNCRFQYLKKYKINSIVQKENDLIVLKPKDLIHTIGPIKNGLKEILKFIIEL